MAGKFGNMFNKAKNRANNGKDYDVMDPTKLSPNEKAAKKQVTKALKAAAKAVAKIIKSIVKALMKAGPIGLIILAVIILVLFIATLITAYNVMPGMMKEKLSEIFKIDVSGWFSNGAVSSLADDYTDIVEVANYLEEMDYNLIGNGFVRPSLRKSNDILTIDEIINLHPEYTYKADDDGKYHFYDESGNILSFEYYDSIGQTINNSTGEVTSNTQYTDEFGIIRSTEKAEDSDEDDRGKVAEIKEADLKNYRLLRTYLLSNYRIYTLKNADQDVLNLIGEAFKSLGGNHDSWAKGLIKLYNAKGGIAEGHWWWGRKLLGEFPVINDKTLSLKKGWFNNPMDYKIEGWAPRYGMSLDFLLSLHLGTNAPDLVYAMLQNFDTEIQVYLDDSGKAKVDARYIDPSKSGKEPSTGDSIEKVETVLSEAGHDISSWLVTDDGATEWFANDWALTKKACQTLLKSDELTLESQDNCLGEASAYVIENSTYQIDEFLIFDTSTNPLEGYNIDIDNDEIQVDMELYDDINSFKPNEFSAEMDGWFGSKSVESYDFSAKHITQSIGVEERFKEDDFTWLSASDFGAYEEGNSFASSPVRKVDFETTTNPFIGYDHKYHVYETIQERHWYREVDGEEVEYTWMTYKFLIYDLGKKAEAEEPGTWEDTIICEFIVREKTVDELVDSGLMTKDENGNYVAVDPVDVRCSGTDEDKCCANCQAYVKAAVKAMAAISDQDFSTYTPYIARVIGSWFRDTYFIIPKEPDAAINEYAGFFLEGRQYDNDGNGVIEGDEIEDTIISTNHPEFDIANSFGENATFVQVDEEYLGDSGEYWTSYVLNDDGDYQLYLLNADGTTSNVKMEDFIKNGKLEDGNQATVDGNPITGYPSKEAAEKDGWAFVKKAVTEKFNGFSTIGIDQSDSSLVEEDTLLWSAYGFDTNGSSTNWAKATRADGNKYVNKLYNIIYGSNSDGDDGSGIFYQLTKTNNVTQVEDAQRSETNALVKYLFKYRQFYIYDGGENKAVEIEHDKQRVLYGYSQYLADQYDFENKYYNTKVIADKYDLKDVKFGNENMDGNFYHYKGLIDKDGNGIMLNEYYNTTGTGWKGKVIDLLNKYGRSALRQSYSWATLSSWIESEDLAEQWLDWQLDMYYMNKYGVDLQKYYNSSESSEELLKIKYDPRDPDLVSTVEITKSSLSVFSILENAGTLDADYAYRDFKELIVELDYFDKEDLSSKIQEVFTWVLPDVEPIGWPNRPWDKQNVDYGTLIQSHDTYAALGVFDGLAGGDDIDESKIFWIGDSWIAGLKGSGVAKSSSFSDHSGKNADAVVVSSLSVPEDTSAFVISFGLNGTGYHAKTQKLVDDLHAAYPDIPIYVLKTSHVASGYSYGSITATSFNASIDTYNSNMKSWCEGKDYVKFVDGATKTINNGDGMLLDNYKMGGGTNDGEYHLNSEGYKVWYQDIISGITGKLATTTATATPNQTTTSSEFEVKDGDGDCDKIVVANGVEYKQFNQSGKYGIVNVYSGDTLIRTDTGETTLSGMGCGIYSSTSLLSAYVEDVNPKKTCQWMHTNIGTSSFNNNDNRITSMNTFLNDNGVSGSWYESDYEAKLKEAFQAGKPVIINIKPGSSDWTTIGGHFLCFTGISSDGTVYTADSVSNNDRLKKNLGSDFDSALSALVSKLVIGRIWIPDNAPTGAKTSLAGAGGTCFQGYEADQTVTSPVTGKILEIGKHDRLNVYTGQMEEVEYIKLQVMDSEDYFDKRIDPNKDYEYETETDYDTVSKALNLFYKEYEDVCAGYTIMIDGFDVDLESDPEGVYEQNEVHALYNSGQMEIRKNKEQAKEDAPFFINYGESEEFPGDEYIASDPNGVEGYYVKEGKAIGKTIVNGITASSLNGENPDETPNPTPEPEPEPEPEPSDPDETDPDGAPTEETGIELPDKLTYTYADFVDVPGDYMRMIIQDTDYGLVDDVERFFDIPEPNGETSFNGVNQEYKAQQGDVEILAQMIMWESNWGWAIEPHCKGDEAEADFQIKCMGYTIVNKLLSENADTSYGDLYDTSDTSRSPLHQVARNDHGGWYGYEPSSYRSNPSSPSPQDKVFDALAAGQTPDYTGTNRSVYY